MSKEKLNVWEWPLWFFYPMSDANSGSFARSKNRLVRKPGDTFYQGCWIIRNKILTHNPEK